MRRILTALLFFGCSLLLTAQTMEQFIEDAEKQHENQNYFGAYDSYRIASEFDESRMDLRYNAADNLRLYTAYKLALKFYTEVRDSDQAANFPELRFRMGQAEQSLGNYDEAIDHYDAYLAPSNTAAANRAEAEKNRADADWAADDLRKRDDLEVTHLSLDINSEYSDFSYRPDTDSLFFSSNRVAWDDDPLTPKRYLTRIFRVMREGSTLDPGRLTHRPTENQLHMAHTAFNTDRSRVYYTMCEYVGATEIVRCDLFYSDLQEGSAKWGSPTKMAINVAGANTTQPHVAVYNGTGTETLFFASDRPGGQGGLDLYMAELNENGTAGEVVALTNLNTAGEDVTPFYDGRGCRLYFSTDGRETLGGQDIYHASSRGNTFGDPVHVNAPVNGSFNDRYYIISREDGKAYFSSNRQTEEAIKWKGDTTSACCDDIYSVPFDETITLDVLTFREIDKTPLNITNVTVIGEDAEGNEVFSESQNTEAGNKVSFMIQPGLNYKINGKRIAFGPADENTDLTVTCDVPESRNVTVNLYLPQLLIVKVFDKKTKEPIAGARVRIATGADRLDAPLEDKVNETGNRYEFLIRLEVPTYAHADKDGYTPGDTTFTIPDPKVNDRGEYTLELYLNKPEPLDLVPLDLYFDNDRPRYISRARYTHSDTSYNETNELYDKREKAFILDQEDRVSGEEQKLQVRESFTDFFDIDVRGGMTRLKAFAGLLEERLELGTKYSMLLTGYASKRGNKEYNQALSVRRVNSVKQYLREYSTVLADAMTNGDLKIDVKYRGEQDSKGDESVYQLQASKWRKVTITDLKATN